MSRKTRCVWVSIGLMCGHSLDFDANSTMISAVQHQRGNSLSFQTIDSTICSLFSCPASIDHDSDILTNNSNPCGPYTICLLSRVAGKQKPLQQQYTHGNHFGKWEKATKLLQFSFIGIKNIFPVNFSKTYIKRDQEFFGLVVLSTIVHNLFWVVPKYISKF